MVRCLAAHPPAYQAGVVLWRQRVGRMIELGAITGDLVVGRLRVGPGVPGGAALPGRPCGVEPPGGRHLEHVELVERRLFWVCRRDWIEGGMLDHCAGGKRLRWNVEAHQEAIHGREWLPGVPRSFADDPPGRW